RRRHGGVSQAARDVGLALLPGTGSASANDRCPMPLSAPRDLLPKVRKLAQLAAELRRGQGFNITRLTSLKSLCQEPEVANRFVTYLARKTVGRVKKGKTRADRMSPEKKAAHRQMMAAALEEMEAWNVAPTEAGRHQLWELSHQMREEQNEYKHI